jgi:hypothetical protein
VSEIGRAPQLAPAKPGESDLTCDRAIFPVDSQPELERQCTTLLLRAAALFDLVEAGEYTPLEAFDRLEHAVHMASPCKCEREILDSFERYDRIRREQAFKDWRWRR